MSRERSSLLWLWILLGVLGGGAVLACGGAGACVYFVGRGVKGAVSELEQANQREIKRRADEQQEDEAGKRNPLNVTLDQYLDDYSANEVAADQKYRGKWIKVDGEVARIAKGAVFEQMYLEIKPTSKAFLKRISCYFPEGASGELAKMSVGQKVTLIGKCKGKGGLWDCELRP